MPLWNKTDTKPKFLSNTSPRYNKADTSLANSSNKPASAAHTGWVAQLTTGGNTIAFTVNAGGNNYLQGATIRVSNVGATNGAGVVTAIDDIGGIVQVYPTSQGTANSTNIADAVITIGRAIGSITVNPGSSGYSNGQYVSLSGSGGGNVQISTNATGGITGMTYNARGEYFAAVTGAVLQPVLGANITVNDGGTGYANGESLIFSGSGGAVGTIATTNSTGGILTVSVSNTGAHAGYTTAPTITVNTAGGSGANLTAALAGTGGTLTVALSGAGANVTVEFQAGAGRTRTETLVAF